MLGAVAVVLEARDGMLAAQGTGLFGDVREDLEALDTLAAGVGGTRRSIARWAWEGSGLAGAFRHALTVAPPEIRCQGGICLYADQYQAANRGVADTGVMARPGIPSGDNELGAFLRSRRAALDPRQASMPDDGRLRRVPGWRREELAQLAHVSGDYVVRLEQGRTRRVSRPSSMHSPTRCSLPRTSAPTCSPSPM